MPPEPTPSPEDLLGRVLFLPDLAAYQEGSIVSRTILKKAAGNVTLFAFAAGQELSEHTAPFDALVSVLDGEAQVTVSGKAHALKAGDTIVMPANHPHAVKAVKNFKMLLVMIKS
jgi:quercetin dioxygenase-like cupin family protein